MAISKQVRQELVDEVGYGRRIETLPIPVDANRFAEAAPGKIRDQLNLGESDLLVTAVGHAIPVKGWDIAIRAMAQVNKTFPNVHLALVGSTSSPDEIRIFDELCSLVQKFDLSNHVHFLGHRCDIPEILKASDIFAMPSRSEGMGAALIEAMAAGLPCVAADVGGIPEVITHGEDGLLFERGSAEELAKHLLNMARNPTLMAMLASSASNRARELGIPAYVEDTFRCYEFLLHNLPPR
jgi:glycosyltransferase involved in cell wall biosynthesis